jgi:hypothetical protein
MCLFFLVLLLPGVMAAQKKDFFNPHQKIHPESLRQSTYALMTELSKKHPGFYRYTPKPRFDFLIDSISGTITDSLTTLQFYPKLKVLMANIRCIHTNITLDDEYENYVNNTSSVLPLSVFVDEAHRIYVTKCHSNDTIPLQSEVLSINGQPAAEILRQLFQSIPADGYVETVKRLVLNHHFALWYQTIIGMPEYHTVTVKNNDAVETYTLKGTTKNVFPTYSIVESAHVKQLQFTVHDNTGILVIHSFAKSVIRKNGQNYKKFIRTTFKTLNKKQVQNLVIDLRYNTGGTDANASFLASHFFDKPFRYWQKIEVTEAIANEIKGLNRLFYKKPIRHDTTYHWQKTWITREFNFYKPQSPSRQAFTGTTYLVTNGLCLSSCADFTAVLRGNNKAIVVGEETGGGYQGNNSGMMPRHRLPVGLIVSVPLMKYTTAVDLAGNAGRGTIPHYTVTRSVSDWIENQDVEMQFVLQLINGKSKK